MFTIQNARHQIEARILTESEMKIYTKPCIIIVSQPSNSMHFETTKLIIDQNYRKQTKKMHKNPLRCV